jgi:hypothetical protein
MKYLIKEMREVVVVEGLPCIKKWNETFQVLEEGLKTQSSLKVGFEPDTLVMNSLEEIVLLRDEDRGKTIFNKEDVITIIKGTDGIEEISGYYNMILNKMLSYERDARIDSLLNKEEEIKWS